MNENACLRMSMRGARGVHCKAALCLSAADRGGKPDLCRAGADQAPADGQGHHHQHCLCPDPLPGEHAVAHPLPWSCLPCHPVIYELLEMKALFLHFHLCLLRGGDPALRVFWGPVEVQAPPLKSGALARGQVFWDSVFWVSKEMLC